MPPQLLSTLDWYYVREGDVKVYYMYMDKLFTGGEFTCVVSYNKSEEVARQIYIAPGRETVVIHGSKAKRHRYVRITIYDDCVYWHGQPDWNYYANWSIPIAHTCTKADMGNLVINATWTLTVQEVGHAASSSSRAERSRQ